MNSLVFIFFGIWNCVVNCFWHRTLWHTKRSSFYYTKKYDAKGPSSAFGNFSNSDLFHITNHCSLGIEIINETEIEMEKKKRISHSDLCPWNLDLANERALKSSICCGQRALRSKHVRMASASRPKRIQHFGNTSITKV